MKCFFFFFCFTVDRNRLQLLSDVCCAFAIFSEHVHGSKVVLVLVYWTPGSVLLRVRLLTRRLVLGRRVILFISWLAALSVD